jgi:hypothetical protein
VRLRIPAQIDTGTEFSTVDVHVLEHLQINPIDEIDVRTPSPTEGPRKFYRYPVCLSLDHVGERELVTRQCHVRRKPHHSGS